MALGDQSLNFRITATGAAAVRELRQVGQEVGGLKPQIDRVSASADALASRMTGVAQALAGAFGVREIVRTAEAYGTMTARLRLATKFTGDFAEVQSALKAAARDTRTPLEDTVGLYAKLAPALNSVGQFGADAVGIVATVNKAIALTGADAQTSSASLTQFAQAMGSGRLQGDELRSVLEGTPTLIAAIAEGLGVSIERLREMGAAGELSTERIIGALQKVERRVDEDFRSLPLTLGQAMTLMQNELLEIIGTADQGSGALQGLSRAIVFVADGVAAFAGAGETIRPVVEFVADAVDGVSRLFRIVGTGLAGYAVMIEQALAGDFDGALATYRQIGAEVQKILLEPLAAEKRVVAEAGGAAQARLKIETDLAAESARLENLRAVAAGRANADILLDDKALQSKRIEEARKATEEQIKGVESLRDALRTAWQGAIDGARRAKEEAAALMAQAADARQSGLDKATDRRMQAMTPEERDAAAGRQARDLTREAQGSAARALIKAYEGDLKAAESLATEAAKQAERAERFAGMITDDDAAASLLEELGEIRAQALQAQAKIKQQEAQQQQELATAIQGQIQAAEQRLVALKSELAKPVSIALDISAASAKVDMLRKRLEALGGVGAGGTGAAPGDSSVAATAAPAQKDVEVSAETTQADAALDGVKNAIEAIPDEKTVIIKTVSATGTATFSDAVSAWNSQQNGFATGGWTGPGRKYQVAGVVHADEFVTRKEVVRQPGALGFLDLFNRVGMRALELVRNGYAAGGLVQRAASLSAVGTDFLSSLDRLSLPGFAAGGLVPAGIEPTLDDSRGSTPIVLDFGQLGRYSTSAAPDVAAEIVKTFQRAALQRGRRS